MKNKIIAEKGFCICKKCGVELPITKEYFSRQKNQHRLSWICKECEKTLKKKTKKPIHRTIVNNKKELKTTKNRIARDIWKHIIYLIKTSTDINKTIPQLGCTIAHFLHHIQNKFSKGMSWKNYGRNGWVIDHIRPLASFDILDPIQKEMCCHYTNLQPMWAPDNNQKNSRYKGKRYFYPDNDPPLKITVRLVFNFEHKKKKYRESKNK